MIIITFLVSSEKKRLGQLKTNLIDIFFQTPVYSPTCKRICTVKTEQLRKKKPNNSTLLL